MKKKTIALFGFAAISALALASCTKPSNTTNPAGTTTAGTTTAGTTTAATTTAATTTAATTTAATTTAATTTAATTTAATTTANTTTANTTTAATTSSSIVTSSFDADTKGLDICLNYQASQGITLRQTNWDDKAGGELLNQGALLPTWKYYASQLKTTIRDAANYSDANDNGTYSTAKNNNFKSLSDNTQEMDLFYNSTSNMKKMFNDGQATNLMPYIKAGKMPYFKQFLEDNDYIRQMIAMNYGTEEEAIYYTPYFDGYNAIERMLIMDTAMTKTVLDAESFNDFDTTINGSGAATNTLQAAKYQPFMDANNNLPEDENFTVNVSVNGELQQITLNKRENIIKQQNALLATGCTGKQLAEQLATYIKEVFADGFTKGIYKNPSDVYVSESAAYNADELIALMRVIKANPGKITGDKDAEIEILCPRGQDNGRIENMADFMSIWGIQGLDGEDSMLYFDAEGKLSDAGSTQATYDGLKLLSQIYDEGLIIQDFYIKGTLGKTGYLNKYFGKTSDDGGYGFMLYDFSASTTAMNTKDEDGVGTADSKRVGNFEGTSYTGLMPVVTPLSYWQDQKADNEQDLADHTNKTLKRYAESNRALKGNSWCIPNNSDNKERAAMLMDFLFSAEGKRANDFATSAYWADEFTSYAGETTPQFNAKTKKMISESATDFWSFLRGYLGSTHGVGYVRSKTINYLATNKYGKIGSVNIESAIASGAVELANVKNENAWGNSVPNGVYTSPSETESYAATTAFWAADKLATSAQGWVSIVVADSSTISDSSTVVIGVDANNKNYSYADVYSQAFGARITNYVYSYVGSYSNGKLLPTYAKLLVK